MVFVCLFGLVMFGFGVVSVGWVVGLLVLVLLVSVI